MALMIFVACLIVIGIVLAYDFYRGSHLSRRISQQLVSSDAEIKSLRETERQLRDEISILENKLRHTMEDPITYLLGWQIFEDRVAHQLHESERHQSVMGIMYVDIDNFKLINDALGYEVGDELLRQVARRLEDCVRQVDSVSRFTKDTFVILLTQLTRPETAAIVAQRILQSVKVSFQVGEHELNVSVCIGVALYPADGRDAQALLRNADHALHLAKKYGKNVCQFYQERMHHQSQRDLAMYNRLSRETTFDEFRVYYMPVMDVANKKVACMNAEIYWQHPELGLVQSRELYDYAEKQRKSNQVSLWLLTSACKQFLAWRKAGFAPNLLSVPLTIKQLENSNFIYQLSHVLQELNFDPERLMIEIKDDMSFESQDALERTFNMLNYLGIQIAIDHFGAGSFSLRYLQNIRVDYVKVDASFIEHIAINERSQALLKSIVFMAQTLSLNVIAEGVVNDQQVQWLKASGCHLMMGPLWGEPALGHVFTGARSVPTI